MQIVLHAGFPAIGAVLMGVVTALFGGVLRDIVGNASSRVFGGHWLSAFWALVCGGVLVGAPVLGAPDAVGLLCASLDATALRALAMVTGATR